jgi:hypothetical protein
MQPSEYPTVAEIGNDTSTELRCFLEMTCEEIFLPPGERFELLARPSAGLLPISIHQTDDGLQIFPHKEFDPDWHIRYKGKVLKPGFPTYLAGHE